jgi:tripartite-type tricarboxylate transporter receptor subunit TctC
MLTTRSVVSMFPVVIMVILGASAVFSQNYPNKPIHVFVSEPGSAFDFYGRIIAKELAGPLGQPLIVENKPSNLTPELLLKSAPDGYTIAMGSGTFWLTPLTQKMPYDAVRDFAPITLMYTYPHILVANAALPVKSVKELVDLAKAKPGMFNIGATASPGGQSFLSTELFKAIAGINLVRVPYKGNAEALVALLAGEVHLMFNDLTSVTPHVKAGKLRALAVTTLEPFPPAPGLPTLAASGVPGYESILIAGMLAPAETPVAIINRLNQEIVRVLKRPDIAEKFTNNGVEVLGSTSVEFAAKIKSEIAKWAKVLKDAGVKMEL